MALPSVDSRPIRTVNGFSSRWNAAHLPLIYTISNTKWPLNSEDTGNFILSFFDTNGYASLVMFTAYTWYEGLYLKITNNSDYNGTYRIRSVVSSTIVVLDTAYISGAATNGYAYPVYSNYTTIVRVYAGLQPTHDHSATKPIELIGTIEQRPDTDNNTIIDVAKYVRTKLSAEYDDSQSSWPNDLNAFTDFYISYAERYDQSSSGSIIDYTSAYTDDAVGGSIYYLHAVNSSLQLGYPHGGNMGDYIIDPDAYKNPGKWMTFFDRPQIVDGSRISLGIIANYTPFSIKRIATEPDGTTEEVTTLISDQDYGVYRIDNDIIQAGQFTETVSVVALIGGVEVSETIIIDVDNQCIDYPEEPSGLTLGNATATTLTADWIDNSTTETGFQVQISLYSDFSSITESATVDAGITTYLFSGLNNGTIYYSRVRALGEVNSEWSDIASAGTIYDFMTALSSDGLNDYVTINNIAGDSFDSNHGFSFWFKSNSLPTGSAKTIFNNYAGGAIQSVSAVKTGFSGSNQTITYSVWTSTGQILSAAAEFVHDTEWHYVLIQFDQTDTSDVRIRISIDGAISGIKYDDNSVAGFTGTLPSTFTATVCLYAERAAVNFSNCQLDQFAYIINQELFDDLSILYNSGNGINLYSFYDSSKFLIYYDFDEADTDPSGNGGGGNNTGISSPELIDKSGNSHTGTLVNFAKTGSTSNWVDH